MTKGQKVKIIRDNGYVYGIITKIYNPCEYHSGRFTVLINDRNRDYEAEFWFSDYGKSVMDTESEKT